MCQLLLVKVDRRINRMIYRYYLVCIQKTGYYTALSMFTNRSIPTLGASCSSHHISVVNAFNTTTGNTQLNSEYLMLDKTTSDGVLLHVYMAYFLLRDNALC